MKKENGVTLVALVITVIVILILAGIIISLTIGQDGIITKAKQAAIETKKSEIKDTIKLDILTAETEAIIRGESLEEAQLKDIIEKYGELQEDGDTIITKEDKFEISLKEIWYGVLSDSGSYTDKVEQIEILEKELAELKNKYEELEDLNSGNSEVLSDLNNKIAELEEQKKILEEQVATLTNEKDELTKENTRLEGALVKLNQEYQEFKKTEATATVGDILSGKTAWVNGEKITGTMVNRGTLNWSPTTSTTYTVPAGYYSGGTLNSAGAYNKGVTDGRVGYYTKAQYDANYTTGYNAGVTAADNRVNTNSTNYKTGYNNGYNAAVVSTNMTVVSLDIEALGTYWHSSYTYNIGAGKSNVHVVLKNFRTTLSDCNFKLTYSYNSSTGVVSWNYKAESSPAAGDFSAKSCRSVLVDIIYK